MSPLSANPIFSILKAVEIKQCSLLCGVLAAAFSTNYALANDIQSIDQVNKQRELAVKQAKAGGLHQAIDDLYRLHRQLPRDVKVKADLIVLLHQAGRNQEIVRVMKGQSMSIFPEYAFLSWILALRDTQHYLQAETLLKQLQGYSFKQQTPRELSSQGILLYLAMIQAESGQLAVARKSIKTIDSHQFNATQYAQLAYTYRLLGNATQSLAFADQALAVEPQHQLAIQQKAQALSNLGAVDKANQLVQANTQLFSKDEVASYQVDKQVNDLKESILQRKYLYRAGDYQAGNQLLDNELQSTQALLNQLGQQGISADRLHYDYVYALEIRGLMPEAVQAFDAMTPEQIKKAPAHMRRAVADAYLALQQPEKALPIYLALLNESANPDVELFFSIYYSHLALEQFEVAEAVLQYLNKASPKFRYSPQNGSDPVANWERLIVDQVIGLHEAYQNQPAKAEQLYADMYAKAPFNVGVMANYATILRWRGLPEQADQLLKIAQQYEPDDFALQLNRAENARDLQQYPLWQQEISPLYALRPDDAGVQRNYAEWTDRARPSLESNLSMGRTDSGQQVSQSNGDKDRESYTRLNSPWIFDHWRPYVEHRDRWIEDREQSDVRDQRVGVGLEWQKERKNAWVSLTQQTDGDEAGINLGWSQQLNDHWAYRFGYSSHAINVPLMALQDGYSASSYHANLNWQQNESRSASLSYDVMDIDDGNLRQSVYWSGNQRIFANEHHITTARAGVYYESNSQQGGRYFNPKNNQGLDIGLNHDWVTWRRYDKSLTQHFEVSTGLGQQDGLDSEPYIDVLYQHRLKLSRTWQVDYGVGWGSRVYDDNREKRVRGVLGLTGIF